MRKQTARQQVLAAARQLGLKVTPPGKSGVVLLFNPRNKWVDCLEGWQGAYDFLRQSVNVFPRPWEARQ
jgi:hypothetical protein